MVTASNLHRKWDSFKGEGFKVPILRLLLLSTYHLIYWGPIFSFSVENKVGNILIIIV